MRSWIEDKEVGSGDERLNGKMESLEGRKRGWMET